MDKLVVEPALALGFAVMFGPVLWLFGRRRRRSTFDVAKAPDASLRSAATQGWKLGRARIQDGYLECRVFAPAPRSGSRSPSCAGSQSGRSSGARCST